MFNAYENVNLVKLILSLALILLLGETHVNLTIYVRFIFKVLYLYEFHLIRELVLKRVSITLV